MKQLKRAACLLVCAVALLSLSTCASNGSGSTITVTITGASGFNEKDFVVGVFPKGADIGGFPPVGIIAIIHDGSASGVAIDLSTEETFEASDGTQYDLSVYIDEDANLEPDVGEQILIEMPKTITVNGDTVVNTVYPDDYMAKPEE